jgi:hypothetical protein
MKRNISQSLALETNQRYLVAEFGRLKLRLRGKVDDTLVAAVEASRAALIEPAPIDVLTNLFGLSVFERDVLLLCAGVEMDAELARGCADVQGIAHRQLASFGLALGTLDEPHWSALAPVAALRRWRMVELDDGAGLTAARLRIDERVLHYLAGINYLDRRLQPLLRPVAAPTTMADEHRKVSQTLLAALNESSVRARIVVLHGDDFDGQSDVAANIAAQLGLQMLRVRAADLPSTSTELDAFAVLWQREAALLGAVLLIESRNPDMLNSVIELAERTDTLIFIAGGEALALSRATLRFSVNKPAPDAQKVLWQHALGPAAARLNGSLDGVATQFRLSAQTILAAGNEIRDAIAADFDPNALLWRACQSASRTKLDDLAQRLEALAIWRDLILPEAQKIILHQIGAQVKHRLMVYQKWGFADKGARGLGISALFAGESGTGKTMAAEVLANDLHLDLYRIDLSAVVSKYIGETEKNLGRVFDAAEDGGAILLFDEADALFGKRSEVRDSHDRYANIEVSYLLQRMEAYRGLAILTTNMKSALDSAFQRRLRFVVQFPFPDQQEREAIWRAIFPPAMPIDGIDYAKLAKLSVAGGNIRNIALNAAFLAADNGAAITMSHLLQAAHGEAAKRERAISDAEIRGWV